MGLLHSSTASERVLKVFQVMEFFCFLSFLIISSPMVETLYQTFLIGFYILSELDLNGARCYLKTDENTFGIQSARQYQLYHCHFCTILLALNNADCTFDKEPEIRSIKVCIIAIPSSSTWF